MILASGCTTPRAGGASHPDFSVEMAAQMLADIDFFITNYAWILALLGL